MSEQGNNFSKKQWRALLYAFPLYQGDSAADRPEESNEWQWFRDNYLERCSGAFEVACPSSEEVPTQLDRLLRHLFGIKTDTRGGAVALPYLPLTRNEMALLSLLSEERKKTEKYYNLYHDLCASLTEKAAAETPPVSLEETVPSVGKAPLSASQPVCEGCQDGGGDLYCCPRCHSYRHEACGGPHMPVDASSPSVEAVESDTLCRDCRKLYRQNHNDELSRLSAQNENLKGEYFMNSSSSSSLRSDTSSSEREEIEREFGPYRSRHKGSGSSSEYSSMDGFIVNSSSISNEDSASSRSSESDVELLQCKGSLTSRKRPRKRGGR